MIDEIYVIDGYLQFHPSQLYRYHLTINLKFV